MISPGNNCIWIPLLYRAVIEKAMVVHIVYSSFCEFLKYMIIYSSEHSQLPEYPLSHDFDSIRLSNF
jgi:hypothetical protein